MRASRRRDAFFLESDCGAKLYCIFSGQDRGGKGAMLFLHPFAEEMNRSRRMVALAAGRFADAGWSVLQVDLLGCGDSEGDFGDASWARWVDNVGTAMAWLRRETGLPCVVWGLRSGCLLASEWMVRESEIDCPALLWQPIVSGRQHLTHFLRLKALSDSTEPEPGTVVRAARARLDLGGDVEVAGYALGAGLAKGLEAATLDFPEKYASRVGVLEVSGTQKTVLSPVLANRAASWQGRGIEVDGRVVDGPAFWLTQETTVAPELIDASLLMLEKLVQ